MDAVSVKVKGSHKYKSNPFVNEELFYLNKGHKTVIAGSANKYLVDAKSGEFEGITLFAKKQEIDKEEFAKIYVDQIKSLFGLSKSGIRVFSYFLSALRINKDEVYINVASVMEFCEYRQSNQVYKGLAELLSNNIIAMSSNPNIWFVNPHIMFNGNRVAFFKEYKIINTKKIKPSELQFPNNIEHEEEVQSNSQNIEG